MTKKIIPLSDYISARVAAQLLSIKHGRPIKPGYIHKIRGVRSIPINKKTKLYHRGDIEASAIRQRKA